jgi:glycosyltransferase involved in cell wall biosynthesis
MRLVVVSHTPHYQRDSQLVGWGPTVRELSYLAELFDSLIHIAPVYDGPAPDSAQPYESSRVEMRPVKPAGGPRLDQKLGIAGRYPEYARVIRRELHQADAVHVRCPANISLLALALLRRTESAPCRWIKYAGNWQPETPDAWSYGLQRRWLAENRHRGVVTVNGRWPQQPAHVRSFDNPSLTDAELSEGRDLSMLRCPPEPAELLFVGALNDAKGAGRALEIARHLAAMGVAYRLRLVGDGPDRSRYEQFVRDNHLYGVVFKGWVPRDRVGAYYSTAHFVLLPSRSEGWPKVLSEGMAYGAVPIAGSVSSIPQVLAETGAGVALPYTDTLGMAGAIADYVAAPETWSAASRAGVAAAPRFGYRAYQQAVGELFRETWSVTLAEPRRESTAERGVV